jgi:hypothetical protein
MYSFNAWQANERRRASRTKYRGIAAIGKSA